MPLKNNAPQCAHVAADRSPPSVSRPTALDAGRSLMCTRRSALANPIRGRGATGESPVTDKTGRIGRQARPLGRAAVTTATVPDRRRCNRFARTRVCV